ncbi:MAG: lycopene cyclase [Bacteroidetes bacterium]|nr:MAG: lycopene cyclase [Bacteroidota bacterium]
MPESKFPFRGQGYDYIISGAGCAGLSLLMYMIDSGKFSDKRILLVDREEKNKNDRTWCFWETSAGLFENCVYKRWDKMWFHDIGFSKLLDIQPYQYKMIRGIDFYKHCFAVINDQKKIDIVYGNVKGVTTEDGKAVLFINDEKITADYIFNSILFEKPVLKKNEHYLLQHFKGCVIETAVPSFNPSEATMMDFRVDQQDGTTFVYVMPFTETKALVEYTLFTETLLKPPQYDEALKNYISEYLKIKDYSLLEEEFGVIPMTNHRFQGIDHCIINIGTAGGQTKASSGYTFMFIQKHSKAIVHQIIKTGQPEVSVFSRRFHFYDSVLLEVLAGKKLSARNIFTPIIKKNKLQHLLRFMDNESSLSEDYKIISSLPTWTFLKAALKQL